MDDIVTFLREDAWKYCEWENACTAEGPCPSCMAADEIERLRRELRVAEKWRDNYKLAWEKTVTKNGEEQK